MVSGSEMPSGCKVCLRFTSAKYSAFPSSDRCGLGVTSMSTAPVRKRGMRGEIKVLQTNFSFTWGNVAD